MYNSYQDMNTYIIRLQAFDDLITIQEKMTWSNSERIILVFPDRQIHVGSRVDFSILKRTARSKGMIPVLVTKNEEMKNDAEKSGLKVFKTLDHAKREYAKRRVSIKPDGLFCQKPKTDLNEIRSFILKKKKDLSLTKRKNEIFLISLLIILITSVLAILWIPLFFSTVFRPLLVG